MPDPRRVGEANARPKEDGDEGQVPNARKRWWQESSLFWHRARAAILYCKPPLRYTRVKTRLREGQSGRARQK